MIGRVRSGLGRSVIAALLWKPIAPAAPFWFGAACAAAAVVVLFAVRTGRPSAGPITAAA